MPDIILMTPAAGRFCFSGLFFVSLVVILNFWLVNLIVAVITTVFGNMRSSQISGFSNNK